jgi:hypothetical protein
VQDQETYYVTSHLMVGQMPTHLAGVFTWADSVDEAVLGLRAGASVVLRQGEFDLARQVLLALGHDVAWADLSVAVSQGLWRGEVTGLPTV